MNLQRFLLLLAVCPVLLAGQSQPVSPAAAPAPLAAPPPGVERALRERVRPFYEGFVDGKFRKAYEIVADDSKDAFLTLSKPHYDGFEIQKVVFSDDFSTAKVTTQIQTTFNFFGVKAPEKSTADTYWRLDDGQWYWTVPAEGGGPKYTLAQRVMMSRFNMTVPGAAAANPPSAAVSPGVAAALPPGLAQGLPAGLPGGMPPGMPSGIPPGIMQGLPPGVHAAGLPGGAPGDSGKPASPAELRQQIAKEVKLDRSAIVLHGDQPGTAVVTITNGMQTPVRISVQGQHVAGLTVSADKTEIAANGVATVTVAWDPTHRRTVPPTPSTYAVGVMPMGVFLKFTVSFQ